MEKKRNKKAILRWILIPLSIILAFTGGFFSHYLFRSKNVGLATDIIKIMEKVGYVYDETTGEKRPISSEEIADALVSGLFDKFSAYYTEEEYKEVQKSEKGNLSGVGLTFVDEDNVIDRVVFNSPAELVGLRQGDKIVGCTLNGSSIAITNRDEFANFVTPVQTNVEFTISVERGIEPLSFNVKKENYVSALVQYKDSQKTFAFRSENGKLVGKAFDGGMALDDKTAYVEFTSFDRGAGEQMEKALAFMKERGRTKLILDLRNNVGGFVDELQKVCELLIYNNGQKKTLVLHAKTANKDEDFYTSSNKFNTDITNISVIANERSASASESLIGAMLHYGDRFSADSLVIEKNSFGIAKTHGKGIMQTTYGLISGGALKLTTGKIFWPDKKTCIQGKGIFTTESNSVASSYALQRAIECIS